MAKNKVRWNGPRVARRVVEDYEWSRETGYVQTVTNQKLTDELLKDPLFELVDEPATTQESEQ